MSLLFEKYHAFGTDYLIYDLNKNKIEFNTNIIRFIYKGNLGNGAKGIIVGPYITNNTMNYKVFNPSGVQIINKDIESYIFSKYLKDSGYTQTVENMPNYNNNNNNNNINNYNSNNNNSDNDLTNNNDNELINKNNNGGVTIMKDDNNMVTISMGTLSFNSRDIGMMNLNGEMINIPFYFGGREYWSTCIYTDSPHLVIPMEEISAEKVRTIGKHSEHAQYFTNPINTEIVKVIDRNNIQIEIYEQGVGYKSSSVKGAIAAAGVIYKLGLVESSITVHMSGGKLQVNINKDMEINISSKISSVGKVYLLDEYIDNRMNLNY